MNIVGACQNHLWRATGRQDVHVEFPTKTEGRNVLFAFYVRCVWCKQDGFKRHPESRVIYTWRKEDAQ